MGEIYALFPVGYRAHIDLLPLAIFRKGHTVSLHTVLHCLIRPSVGRL